MNLGNLIEFEELAIIGLTFGTATYFVLKNHLDEIYEKNQEAESVLNDLENKTNNFYEELNFYNI